jgi:MarR family transcriptional regulator, organic hydroperoxide resistance regulator
MHQCGDEMKAVRRKSPRAGRTARRAKRAGWSVLIELLTQEFGRFAAASAELGLTAAQANLLWKLKPGTADPMSAIAGAMACDNSNVTGLVDRLEAQGLVTRTVGRDRRVKTISLTARGEDVRSKLISLLDAPPAQAARLSAAEQQLLLDLVSKLRD